MKKKPKTITKSKDKFLDLLAKIPPFSKFDKHYWADYIELKCFVNRDKQFTQAEFLDLFIDNRDFESMAEVETSDESNENDSLEIFVQECFELIYHRQKIFFEHYPFQLSVDKKVLNRKKRIALRHKLYFFFLFCSTLRYTRMYQSELTSSFEMLGKEVFKNLLPKGAKVYLFGSGNSLERDRRYTGNLWSKINLLAEDFFEVPKAKRSDFPPTDVGDKGLDIVGWLPNGKHDKRPHLMALLGQSACTPEWETKQFTSSSQAWWTTITFSVPPINVILCPYSIRNVNGEWHRGSYIGSNLMLDRQRLIHHFKDNFAEFKKWSSFKVVNNLINVVEPIF